MADALTDKVAVITGGSKGIGKAIALDLAHQGCDSLIIARTESELAQTAAEINEATGRRIEIAALDLTSLEACESAQATAQETFGKVDILVNNAGDTKGGPFTELSDDVWQAGFDLKFWAAVRLSRLLWPALVESQGTVLNIIGGFARTPAPDTLIGGSVNAAMSNFSKGLAGLGMKDGVSVNAILPGPTLTDRMKTMFENRGAAAGMSADAFQQQLMAKQGVSRFGEPEDVAAIATFLCSPAAQHIQGVNIACDGGATKGLF